MDNVDAEQVKEDVVGYVQRLRDGDVFIYPTDTVYGIGCDATNQEAVRRVRQAKRRPEKPMSVIAPSKQWITERFRVPDTVDMDKLPGPYTFILRPIDAVVTDSVAPGVETLGVRIPNHWFTGLVEQFGRPVVTTSANISGEPTIQHPSKATESLQDHVDIAVDDGRIGGSASTIIDHTGDQPERIR